MLTSVTHRKPARRLHRAFRLAWPGLAAVVTAALFPSAASADLVETIARAKPAIVAVGTFRATDSPRFTFRGTGFAVGDGRQVMTAAHVLPDVGNDASPAALAVQVRVDRDTLQARPATVQAIDREHDVALLRIEGGDALPTLPLAAADAGLTPEGRDIALIGFPLGGALGYTPVAHRGIVAAVTPGAVPLAAARSLNEQAIRRLRATPFDIYQLDAVAYPGNSGGPVLDAASGQVIGIVSLVFVKGARESALTQPSGITYAMPVGFARALLGAGR